MLSHKNTDTRSISTLTYPFSAPAKELPALEEFVKEMFASLKAHPHGQCRLIGPSGETIPLPESVFTVLARVAEVLAQGNSITILPVGKLLTTQQAADILNVSRQYLIRLLDEEALPFSKTGKHRRILTSDLIAYKQKRDKHRKAALDRITRISESIGGYSELK